MDDTQIYVMYAPTYIMGEYVVLKIICFILYGLFFSWRM